MKSRYAIALGSNVRHPRFGQPRDVLAAALERLARKHVRVVTSSTPIASRPIGPSRRSYANMAAIVETRLDPPCLLRRLKKIERHFGRRSRGARWSARILDLDMILWSGGAWASPGLVVPHVEFRRRDFVLGPLCAIAGGWRDPLSNLTVRQLKARLDRRRPAA